MTYLNISDYSYQELEMSKVKDISRRTFLKGAGAAAASTAFAGFPNIIRADNHEINLIGWGSDWFDPIF